MSIVDKIIIAAGIACFVVFLVQVIAAFVFALWIWKD